MRGFCGRMCCACECFGSILLGGCITGLWFLKLVIEAWFWCWHVCVGYDGLGLNTVWCDWFLFCVPLLISFGSVLKGSKVPQSGNSLMGLMRN